MGGCSVLTYLGGFTTSEFSTENPWKEKKNYLYGDYKTLKYFRVCFTSLMEQYKIKRSLVFLEGRRGKVRLFLGEVESLTTLSIPCSVRFRRGGLRDRDVQGPCPSRVERLNP